MVNKKYISFLIFLLYAFITMGQCPINTSNTGITAFDWQKAKYEAYYQRKDGNNNIVIVKEEFYSPFVTHNIANENVSSKFWNYPNDEKDYQVEDGWVLFATNFGSPNQGISIPSFALYNRYSAILRTFFYVPEQSQGYSNARVELFLKSVRRSALLNHITQPAKALDKVQDMITRQPGVPNNWTVGVAGGFWLYADFPMAYDPCICEALPNTNNNQEMWIRPILMNVQSISLTGNNIPNNKVNVMQNGNLQWSGTSFNLSQFIDNNGLIKALDAGTKAYKSTNEQVQMLDLLASWFGAEKDTVTKLHLPTSFAKGYPKAAFFMKVAEFFITAFNKTKAPTTPISAEASMKYSISGDITEKNDLEALDVITPGSQRTVPINDPRIPKWDNPLGLFAILETPILEKSVNYLGYNTTYNDEEKLYRYRLNSQNIKYAVNPAAGLELSSLSSSIVLTGKDSFIAEATRRVITSSGIQTIKIGDNVLFPNFFRFTEANKSRLPNAQTNLDIIGLLEDTSQVKQFVRYESPYLSLTCMNDYVLSFLSLGLREPKVEVKILARFKRKSDPRAEEVVFMSTYEVKIQNVSSDIPMTQLSTIPRSVNVTTNEIYELDPNCSASHSLHDPCPMIGIGVGQNLNIVALEKITISGKFFPANSMSFIAGKEIEILPNTEMPPNAHLEIRPILNCGGILPAATNNEITTFCTNKQKYNPIYVAKNRQDTVKKELALLDVSVFPNPTQHNINVEISTSSKENLRIILQNTLGQIIYQKEIEPNESGSYQETIGTDNLPTGIYYLTLQTKNGIKTQKVLKTN